jgi:two-component system, NarL family, response regulator
VIVDDQEVVREGFSSVLSREVSLTLVGCLPNGEEALLFLQHNPVDVVLLDLNMPGMSGIETQQAVQSFPSPPRIVILSSLETEDEVCHAVEMGAQGYLRKDTSSDEILKAIYAVHAGRSYLPMWILARMSDRSLAMALSRRELEILEMVAKGLTNKEIGRAFQVSHFTVRNHVRHIMAKLEVGDRTEAATLAIQNGLLNSFQDGKRPGWSQVPQTKNTPKSRRLFGEGIPERSVAPVNGRRPSFHGESTIQMTS